MTYKESLRTILVGWTIPRASRFRLSVWANCNDPARVCNKGVTSSVKSGSAWQAEINKAIKGKIAFSYRITLLSLIRDVLHLFHFYLYRHIYNRPGGTGPFFRRQGFLVLPSLRYWLTSDWFSLTGPRIRYSGIKQIK